MIKLPGNISTLKVPRVESIYPPSPPIPYPYPYPRKWTWVILQALAIDTISILTELPEIVEMVMTAW